MSLRAHIFISISGGMTLIALYSLERNADLEQIRVGLLTQGIPCICLGPYSADCSVLAHTPIVYLHTGCEIISDGFAGKIPPSRFIHASELLSPDRIIGKLYSTYRIDYNVVSHNGVRFDGNDVYFRNNYVRLTHSEKLITRLLTVCHGMFFTAVQIAGFCLENLDAAAVPVHISRINNKSSAVCGEKIITPKRYYGYKIP